MVRICIECEESGDAEFPNWMHYCPVCGWTTIDPKDLEYDEKQEFLELLFVEQKWVPICFYGDQGHPVTRRHNGCGYGLNHPGNEKCAKCPRLGEYIETEEEWNRRREQC